MNRIYSYITDISPVSRCNTYLLPCMSSRCIMTLRTGMTTRWITVLRSIMTFCFIMTLFFLPGTAFSQAGGNAEVKDSVDIPLKIRTGIDITGPVIWFTDKSILTAEAYISTDLNEKFALFLGAGYSDYSYSQYNYDYLSKGSFFKAGMDFNLLRPEIAAGKYWAGIGIRYGISSCLSETPSFTHENYWGSISSAIKPYRIMGHYLEISPGFRAELFKNFSIGWSVNLRKLISPGQKKDLRPLWLPGYGSGESVTAGAAYYISWNIPYRKIRVGLKKDEPEEYYDDDESGEAGRTEVTVASAEAVQETV